MALYTTSEINTLDLIGPFGPHIDQAAASNMNTYSMDLIGPFGPMLFLNPIGVSPPTFDATKMFLIF